MTDTIKCKKYPPFSVVISVYKYDKAKWLDIALESIVSQSVKPSEIVLVVDGPVSDSIQEIIDKYIRICKTEKIFFKLIKFTENKGLGEALRVAVDKCSNELIARMDSDDIAVGNRFELQLKRFADGEIDICGGQIKEFIDNERNIIGKRKVPLSDAELKKYMKKRCPFNHVTVMYKRSAVIEAGNYQDWFWNEDYYLWIRMAIKKQRFANISDTLVYVRVGKDMYARRGGKRYYKSEKAIQKYMLSHKIITLPTYMMNCGKRFIVERLLPNRIRGWIFRKFARS